MNIMKLLLDYMLKFFGRSPEVGRRGFRRFFGRLMGGSRDDGTLGMTEALLIHRLKQTEPVNPSPEFLTTSRAHLLSVIRNAQNNEEKNISIYLTFRHLIAVMTKLSSSVFLDARIKSLLRERVKNFATLHEFPHPSERVSWFVNWGHFLFGNRRAWAFIALSVFVVAIGIPFTIQNPDQVFQMTYLRAEGKVLVEREGKEISVLNEIILQQGDTVKTQFDSTAEIYFLDDSVSRLAPDTEIKLTTLSGRDDMQTVAVEMNVAKGRVWSNVAGPSTDSSSFTVTAEDISGTVDSRAAFDLTVVENDVTVLAANNTVNLTVKQEGTLIQKTLVAGESLKLEGAGNVASFLGTAHEPTLDPWIDENLQKDASYQMALRDKYRNIIAEKAGILPNSPLYGVKKLSESATVALTFDSVEKEKKKLEIANRRLLEAETLLFSGDTDAGKALLGEYQETVSGVYEKLDEENMSGLAIESLDSLLSEVKSSLEKVAVLVESADAKKLMVKLDLSLHALISSRELLQKNASQTAIFENFRSYRMLAEETVSDIQALSSPDRSDMMSAIFEHKIEELMVLRVLEGVSANENIQKRISALKINLLWDVNRILFSTGLTAKWHQALLDQKSDEYVQKNILQDMKELSRDREMVSFIERFERYYLSNFVKELVKKDQIITPEFSELLLSNSAVTPNSEEIL